MGKWDSYSRRELRQRRRAWLRRNAKGAVLVILGTVALAAIVSWSLAAALSGATQWYALGVLHAGLAGGIVHLFDAAFLAADGRAIWQVRGAWGEENTRGELKRARRRRCIWGWVDSINFQAGDLDHVVVARTGGLIAIDSKWRNTVSRADAAEMARAAKTAQRRTEALARTLLTKERGSHRARGQSLTVTPVVVVWGGAQSTIPHDAVVDGVRILPGRKLVPWLRTLDGDRVPREAARDVLARMRDYRSTTWER